jgi:hypothetical protein
VGCILQAFEPHHRHTEAAREATCILVGHIFSGTDLPPLETDYYYRTGRKFLSPENGLQ